MNEPTYTQNRLAVLTGIDRRTIEKRLATTPTRGSSKRYDLKTALHALCRVGPVTEHDISESAARRNLAVARTAKIETEHRVLQRGLVPIEFAIELTEKHSFVIRHVILDSGLSDDDKAAILAELCRAVEGVTKLGPEGNPT